MDLFSDLTGKSDLSMGPVLCFGRETVARIPMIFKVTATATTAEKKMHLYFTFKFRNYLELLSTQSGLKSESN